MIHFLQFKDFAIVGISAALQLSLFFLIREKKYTPIRWFLFYCAVRNLALVPFLFLPLNFYGWAYWHSEMIKFSWLAWIASEILYWHHEHQMDDLMRPLSKIPFICVLMLSAVHLWRGPHGMQAYEHQAQTFILIAFLAGAVAAYWGKYLSEALPLASIGIAGFGAALWWNLGRYNPAVWEIGGLAAVCLIAGQMLWSWYQEQKRKGEQVALNEC